LRSGVAVAGAVALLEKPAPDLFQEERLRQRMNLCWRAAKKTSRGGPERKALIRTELSATARTSLLRHFLANLFAQADGVRHHLV
jgi:hypothetical protein